MVGSYLKLMFKIMFINNVWKFRMLASYYELEVSEPKKSIVGLCIL